MPGDSGWAVVASHADQQQQAARIANEHDISYSFSKASLNRRILRSGNARLASPPPALQSDPRPSPAASSLLQVCPRLGRPAAAHAGGAAAARRHATGEGLAREDATVLLPRCAATACISLLSSFACPALACPAPPPPQPPRPLQAINNFCREIGVTRSEGEVHLHKLDHHIRADLDATRWAPPGTLPKPARPYDLLPGWDANQMKQARRALSCRVVSEEQCVVQAGSAAAGHACTCLDGCASLAFHPLPSRTCCTQSPRLACIGCCSLALTHCLRHDLHPFVSPAAVVVLWACCARCASSSQTCRTAITRRWRPRWGEGRVCNRIVCHCACGARKSSLVLRPQCCHAYHYGAGLLAALA